MTDTYPKDKNNSFPVRPITKKEYDANFAQSGYSGEATQVNYTQSDFGNDPYPAMTYLTSNAVDVDTELRKFAVEHATEISKKHGYNIENTMKLVNQFYQFLVNSKETKQ